MIKGESYESLFERIGERLRERVDKVKYDIVEDEKEELRNFFSFGIINQEYQKAQELKQNLLNNYKGTSLEEVIDGEELKTKTGTCYHIQTQEKITVKRVNQTCARERILSNLKLV
ncbi:MAG: hypothetical protein HXS48_21165, partial [Theionarchaea archaeon]|nr:hypothetical protein [Theionarchaea archaeon]